MDIDAAFADAGEEFPERWMALGGFDSEYALVHTRNFLAKNPRPTAIISGGIGSTAGSLRALNELEIEIGKDIAFVALDEWPLFDIFRPKISSVSRDAQAMGVEAAHLLLEMLNGKKPSESVIETKFTARASTDGGI